ncbi:cytochrome P450 [Mucor lusitanicus]|uniref:Cytochrome P450 n=2 Tax=Mucor circinelloides f. lusitanicus TaxID=29924 RepID=A0A8H4EW72_MUCCL|nr:cytochrome P450 [Mucor lusitanicus]
MESISQLINSVSATVPKRFEQEDVKKVVSVSAAIAVLYTAYKMVSNSSKKRAARKQGLKEIPVPGGSYPIVGHLLSLGSNPSKTFSKWHQELGPIINVHMGVKEWVLLSDPVLAHKIFVIHGAQTSNRIHQTYSSHYYSIDGLGTVFAQPGPSWREARAVVASALSPKLIDTKYMGLVEEEAAKLVDRLIAYSKAENGVNPSKHLHLNSLNIVFSIGFGKRYENIEDPEFDHVSECIVRSIMLGSLENDLASFIPAYFIVDYFAGSETVMRNFIENERNPRYRALMAEGLAREGPNVVKSLEEFNLTADEKLVIMSDLIAGGTDTVSITLGWNFALMCHYPQVQKRAADEIDEFVKEHGRFPTFSERAQVPFCVATYKECMRFRSTTPFGVPHCTNEDVVIDGYLIKKNTALIATMDSMHRNPDFYPEPERFYPERYLNNLKTMHAATNGKLEERDTFNFGFGRRQCAAIYLAEVELFVSFIQALGRCTIEPIVDSNGVAQMPDIDNPVSALTSSPAPYKVMFVPRERSA